jgi:hypothetical protein
VTKRRVVQVQVLTVTTLLPVLAGSGVYEKTLRHHPLLYMMVKEMANDAAGRFATQMRDIKDDKMTEIKIRTVTGMVIMTSVHLEEKCLVPHLREDDARDPDRL